MPKLYLVRHAEPALRGVLLGREDPELSPRGREEARLKLGSLKVKIVYTSPLVRCRETARVISAPVAVLDELAEISLGDWDGRTWEEIEERWPEAARRKLSAWSRVTPPGGEPWTRFQERVLKGLERIAAGALPAAVVGHLAANAVIAERLTGRPAEEFVQQYCEVKQFEIEPGGIHGDGL